MFQNTLSNEVVNYDLDPNDQLKLGQVKVWGVRIFPITVTMKAGGTETPLTFSYNPLTEVRSVFFAD